MGCSKCNGKMVYEVFEDLQDDTGTLYFYGWRCLQCGEIIDPVIMSNRERKPAPMVSKARIRK